MNRLTKDYFGGSVILVGYSSEDKSFSRMVYKEMVAQGIRVYPLNRNESGNYDIQVHQSLADLDSIPETACVLVGKNSVLEAIKALESYGVKRVLIQSRAFANEEVEIFCRTKGIELTAGCPFMAIGKGLHRFHGFLAGVR